MSPLIAFFGLELGISSHYLVCRGMLVTLADLFAILVLVMSFCFYSSSHILASDVGVAVLPLFPPLPQPRYCSFSHSHVCFSSDALTVVSHNPLLFFPHILYACLTFRLLFAFPIIFWFFTAPGL